MNIHPLAVVSPAAQIGQDVRIGPFCVIEPDVILGDGCELASHVVIRSGSTLGSGNKICERTVIGGVPQHLQAPEQAGRVVIGSGNTFREMVTIHRAMDKDSATIVGDNNMLMVNVHVAHDCHLGDHVIVVNNGMLAGHVTIEDRAYLGGAVGVHQFCRIGSLAMVGGQSAVVKDIPPFITLDGDSACVVGLNQVGLRRAGYLLDDIRQLKAAYRTIYRSGLAWDDVLEQLQAKYPEGPAAHFHEFFIATKRGIAPERRTPPGATIKIHRDPESETPDSGKTSQAKVG
ncbi:MAG: acyl-ACP--UDP-N-acetylglucosamine O-acyltransferase [Planctomycetes bacterium]|nr:acyl-ACP--UDP-N-acetylglucosamine O-acyltransferase [Planctomycetota bacterium]